MIKPNNPIPDADAISIAKQSGAQWIRYDCKHWILNRLVWKIFRLVDGVKQQAFIGYGDVDWWYSMSSDWEIGLLGERPIDGIEII